MEMAGRYPIQVIGAVYARLIFGLASCYVAIEKWWRLRPLSYIRETMYRVVLFTQIIESRLSSLDFSLQALFAAAQLSLWRPAICS
jgi:hypothetical protein